MSQGEIYEDIDKFEGSVLLRKNVFDTCNKTLDLYQLPEHKTMTAF
jgi:hypothetical protein